MQVLYCGKLGPTWQRGVVTKRENFVKVETLEGTNMYRLFDHVTIGIQLKGAEKLYWLNSYSVITDVLLQDMTPMLTHCPTISLITSHGREIVSVTLGQARSTSCRRPGWTRPSPCTPRTPSRTWRRRRRGSK